MPTAAVFRASADDLDDLAGQIVDGFRSVDSRWSHDVVTGGRLQLTIERAMDATHGNVMAATAEFRALSEECRRRAAECDRYTAEMATYRSQQSSYQRAYDNWRGDPDALPRDRPLAPRHPVKAQPWVTDTYAPGDGR